MRWHELTKYLCHTAQIQPAQNLRENFFHFARQEVPWDSVVLLAEMDGVAGLLHHHLKRAGADRLLPDPARQHLENISRLTAEAARRAMSLAETLSALLDSAALSAIALQGLSVIDLYPHPSMRPLGDFDLMVRPRQKERLKTILQDAGFRTAHPAYPDLLYKNGMSIDLHTHILNLDRIRLRSLLFPEDLTAMWQDAVPFFHHRQGLRKLAPSDSVIALAAHALKHSFSRLIWLVDLKEAVIAVTRRSDGWQEIYASACRWRQRKVVVYALVLLEMLFGLNIPGEIRERLGFYGLNPVERYLLRLRCEGFVSTLLCNALWLQNIRGAGNKIRFIRETVYPGAPVLRQIFSREKQPGAHFGIYLKRTRQAAGWIAADLGRAAMMSLRSLKGK